MAQVYVKGLGTVSVPDRLVEPDNKAELMDKLTTLAAETVPQEEWYRTFTEDFARAASEMARGIRQKAGEEDPNEWNKEFWAQVYAKQNPKASTAGGIAGGFADVLAAPFGGFARKGAKLIEEGMTRGAQVGGVSGLLAPTYDGLTGSQAELTATGVATGLGLGGSLAAVLKLFGVKNAAELEALYRNSDAAKKAEIEKAVEEFQGPMLPEGAGPTRREFEEANFVGPKAQTEESPVQDLVGPPLPRAETDIEQLRFDYQQKQDIARQVDEMEAEVKTLPASDEQAGIFKTIKTANDEVEYLDGELARLNREYNILSNKKRTDEVRRGMDVKQRQINKTKALQQQRINERDFAQESVNRFKELKAARKEIANYRRAEKKGEEYTPSFVKLLEAPKKPVMRQKQETVVPQQVEPKQPAEPFVGPQRRVVVQTPPEMPAPQAAQVASQVEAQPIVSDAQVAPRPKSLSAGGANNMDLPPEETQRILNMNVNSRAAQSTPPATGRQGKVESEADFVRASVRQELERQYGIEGAQKITRQDVIDEANQVRGMVNRMEAEGSMEGGMPAYLLEQMSRNGMLEPHEALLLEEVAAEATWQMSRVATKIRSLSRTPSKDGVAEMQRVQELANQIDTFNRLREWERYGEDAKRKASALLRSYRDANRIAQENMKDLQAGRVVNQLFFGVDC